MKEPLAIIGSGAITAVGLTTAQTCAAIRAGISGFKETSLFHSPLQPVIGAPAPLDVPFRFGRSFERLLAMATHALRECLIASRIEPSRSALFLCIRERYRIDPELGVIEAELRRAIERELQISFNSYSSVLAEGNAGAFRALQRAGDLLSSGKVEHCVVGGVDSLINLHDLKRFEATYRIKRAGVSQGFIPGEGAAFVALCTSKKRPGSSGTVLGVGLASEGDNAIVLRDGYPTGKALQQALERAVQDADVPEAAITLRISDLNGESYRGVESMIAENRFYRTRREHMEIWHPADCVGEIGAAAGALLLVVALNGILRGYAPGSPVMCEASSDMGLRGGCVVAS
jgi:3-oxoacyl-[acyl-carrier-protein] synthase-1